MPLGLLIIGAIVLVAALRNTHRQLGTLIAADFTGAGNFLYWVAALAIVGGLGYIPAFKGPSRMLLALIFISFMLKNGSGFFDQFKSAIAGASAASSTAAPAALPAGVTQAPPAGEPAAPGPIPVTVTNAAPARAGGAAGDVAGIAGAAKSVLDLGGLFGL